MAVASAAGCAAGALFGLGVTIISDSDKPDRNFGFVLAAQQFLAAILLFTLPDLVIVPWGFQGLNFVLAMVSLLLQVIKELTLHQYGQLLQLVIAVLVIK